MEIKHNLFKRKDGRWVLAVAEGGNWKKVRQQTAPKEIRAERDAKAWAEIRLAEITQAGGVVVRDPRAGILVKEAWPTIRKVRAAHPDIRTSTIKNYDTHLKKHILPRLGNAPMALVDVPEARQFIRDVRAAVAANTCRNVFSTARMLWDSAAGEGLIKIQNPFRTQPVIAELPAAKTKAGKVIALTVEEIQVLLDCPLVPLARRARYALAVTAGLADGELAGLTWGATFRGVLDVTQANARFDGIGQTKTENRVRKIPLHPAAAAALRQWFHEGWEPLVRRKPKPQDIIFPDADGNAERPRSARLLRADLERAGLASTTDGGHNFTFHALRRTFSTTLRRAGVDVETRGALMGHAGKTVTERNYTDEELAPLREAVGRIPLEWNEVVREVVRTTNPGAQHAAENAAISGRCGWDLNPRVPVLQTGA